MVKSRSSAPKTINRILKAMTIPLSVEAAIQGIGVFQMKRARRRVIRKARGMALVAGHRNPTMKTKMATMGRAAIRARIPTDMEQSFVREIKISKKFQ
jgi:hypothetical protein